MNAYLVIFFIFRVTKTSSAKERYTYKDPIGLAGLFQNHLIHPDGKPRFKRNTSSIPLKMFTGCWCGSWWVIKGIVRRTVCHPNLVYTLATVLSPLFFFPVDWLKPFKAFDLIPFTKTTAWPPDGSFCSSHKKDENSVVFLSSYFGKRNSNKP